MDFDDEGDLEYLVIEDWDEIAESDIREISAVVEDRDLLSQN